MGTKLSNAPVYYTVAQVQFNPVLDLDSYVPAIQSKMRDAHFPDFKKEVFQRLDFPVLDTQQGQMVPPTMTTQARYLFGDIAGQTAFLLETNALTLQTTAYDTFETFSASLMAALGVLHTVLRLDFVERIGLRYLDAIQPIKEGETLRDFLVPEVLGLSLREHGQLKQSISETAADTDAGQLVSRVIVRKGEVGLPMELSGVTLAIAPRFTQRQGIHAIVDTDVSFFHREAFEPSSVEARLAALHDEISASFKATVTDHAWASWA
jgi:uncharacterized protein (TIGR04255 family)